MKNKKSRLTSFLLMLTLLISMIIPAVAAPRTNYKLTGNQAKDVVAVATAQKGLTRKDFGYTEDWCAYFVCWAGRTAGANFPKTNLPNPREIARWFVNNNAGTFYYFRDANYQNLVDTGTVKNKNLCVKSSRNSFSPQEGDLIIYRWSDEAPQYNWSHIGIVTGYPGNGLVSTVEGNVGGGQGKVDTYNQYYDSQVVGIVRPNYNNTTTQTKPTTLSTNTSNITLDLSTNTSQTITLTIGGTLPNNCKLNRSISNSDIVSNEWVNYTGGTVVTARITGKNAGTATITYTVIDGNTQKVYATKAVKVTVKEPSYTVNYNANGGSGAPSAQTKSYQKPLSLSSTQPTRSGYTFAGWATSPNGSVQYRPGVQYMTDKDITLYAVWTPEKVAISFDKNAYTVKQGEQVKINFTFTGNISGGRYSVEKGDVCKVIDQGVEPNQHYGFVTCETYAPGTTNVTLSLCDKNDNVLASKSVSITVEPIAPTTYTVRYDANGGSNAPAAQTKNHQKDMALSSAQPTRSGYTFAGWATSSNGSVQYRPGERYSKDQDVTLYAIWKAVPSKFSVSISCNDYVPNNQDILDVVRQSSTEYTCYLNYSKADSEIPATFYLSAIVDGRWENIQYTWATDRSNLLFTIPDGGSGSTARAIVFPNGGFGDVKITVVATNGLGQTDSATIVFHIKELSSTSDNSTTVNSKTYFETLTPTSQSRYTGNMGDSFIDVIGRRNGNVDVSGNSYEHGLTAWVARWNYTAESSWVQSQYSLNGTYKTLSGKVVLIKSQNETDFDTQLTISSGNTILYTKRLTPSTLPTEEFQINVSGATTIEISFTDNRAVAGGTAFGLANLSLQ